MIPAIEEDPHQPKMVFITPILDNYGAARTLKAILNEMEKSKVETEVWYPRDSQIEPAFLTSFSPVIHFRQMDLPVLRRKLVYDSHFPIKLLSYARSIIAIRDLAKSFRYSKTVFHIFTSASILSVFFAPRKRRFLSVHEFSKNRFEWAILRILFIVSGDARIFASKSVKDHYSLSGRVIHSGANIKQFARLNKQDYSPGKTLQILCVGRITETKGQLVAIEALAELRKEFTNFHAIFLGSAFGDEDDYLTDCLSFIEQHDLGDCISLPGEVADVSDYYENSHVLIVPSIQPEAFGKVIVEGMASGNVVIATNIGGPTEIISNTSNGFLVDPCEPTQLFQILLAIANYETEISAISSKAKQDARNFDEEESGQKYANYIFDFVQSRMT